MIRPELMDALAMYHEQLGQTEKSTWETIQAKGGDREQVVEWFKTHINLLLAIVPLLDHDQPTEALVVAEAMQRTQKCLERLGIDVLEVVELEQFPPSSLN